MDATTRGAVRGGRDVDIVRKGLEQSVVNILHQVDDSQLVLDDSLAVETEVMDIARNWMDFGKVLCIRQGKLDTIKEKECSSPRQCLSQVVQEFLKMNYDSESHGPPSWRLVVIATAHRAGGDNTGLALKIAADHKLEYSLVAYLCGPGLVMQTVEALEAQRELRGTSHTVR
jgi:hypothetical protein